VNDPAPGDRSAPSTGRAAFAISQAYDYVVAAIGLAFLLGGTIAALIGARKWVLPAPEAAGSFGLSGPTDRNDAIRSLLGALAFAIPGAALFVWHFREGRRRDRRAGHGAWGGVLYFHLVSFIAVLIALGGVVALLHSLRDAVVPFCYAIPGPEGAVVEIPSVSPAPGDPSPIPPIEGPISVPLRSEECFPSSAEAVRSAIDAGIVAAVAGAAWVWHLGRGRRAVHEPDADPVPLEGSPADD
jgi:hypothetical protein